MKHGLRFCSVDNGPLEQSAAESTRRVKGYLYDTPLLKTPYAYRVCETKDTNVAVANFPAFGYLA